MEQSLKYSILSLADLFAVNVHDANQRPGNSQTSGTEVEMSNHCAYINTTHLDPRLTNKPP